MASCTFFICVLIECWGGGKEERTQNKHNHDEVKHLHLGIITWSFRMLHELFVELILH